MAERSPVVCKATAKQVESDRLGVRLAPTGYFGGLVPSENEIGEFIGIFAGDGSYCMDSTYHHQVRVHIDASDTAYIKHVANLMELVLDKKPNIYSFKKYNVSVIRIRAKSAINFIRKFLVWEVKKSHTIRLVPRYELYNNDFLIGFLRGMIDTDGHININRKYAQFSTTSEKLANDIEHALSIINVNYRKYVVHDKRGNRKPMNRIVIGKDFDVLMKIITPKHINYLISDTINA